MAPGNRQGGVGAVLRVAFATLGCKVNQFDSALMEAGLEGDTVQVVPFESPADIYVINTCTVTARSDAQSRQLIRRALRQNARARVVVTGCYAQRAPEEIRRIPGVDLILGNPEKQDWIRYLRHLQADPAPCVQVGDVQAQRRLDLPKRLPLPRGRTRGVLKIQEGCDYTCAFCLIPSTRGPSRSAPLEALEAQARALVQQGYRELVLTGVQIGLYGRDLQPRRTLVDLLQALERIPGLARVRLSSIDPREVTPELVRFMARSSRICRHLHIPAQSGSDEVLRRMDRHYTAREYLELLQGIAEAIPGVAIGSDWLVGFPGEGEDAFRESLALVEAAPLSYLHVFPYSPRPGTPAWDWPSPVKGEALRERAAKLRALGQRKNLRFRQRLLGHAVTVLVEDPGPPARGLTDHYVRVTIQDRHVPQGILVRCRVDRVTSKETLAVFLGTIP